MDVVIVGAGQVGWALAGALASRHRVILASRTPSPEHLARAAEAAVAVRPLAEPFAAGEVVLLALPFAAAVDLVQHRTDLQDRLVLDATNPLTMTPHGLALSPGPSGAHRLADARPGLKLAKVFNQAGWNVLGGARRYAPPPLMFVAGDDADAVEAGLTLARDAGFEAAHAGGLGEAGALEMLALLWIRQSTTRGRDFAFAISRQEVRP
jgi:predicted dinucleotide-binding enzyme